MRKIVAVLLAALLLLTQVFAAAEESGAEQTEYTRLVVGHTTQMKGDFFTGMWGNTTSDIDVRVLLHDYDLIYWDSLEGMFNFNPSVVTEFLVTEEEDGDRAYTMVLSHDLFYSDGSRITAWDYAFSILLQIAPEITEIGGVPVRKDHLVGSAAYLSGETPYLSGVSVGGDDMITITLDHQYLPFFFEMGLLMCNPYPISVIAPGVRVKDDGNGVYLANIDETLTEPVFTAELLKETILNPETGYLSHPSVVSGPYVLTSWDGVTAEFAINEYYKGNPAGEKPSIPTLVFTLAKNETMIDQLKNGEFDLLNKVLNRDAIDAGMELIGAETHAMSNYPRTGLCYISFCCEHPAANSEAVRKAVAWCLDRDALIAEYSGNYGLRVDGYYGIGQWMYGLVYGTVDPPMKEPETAEERQANEEARAAWDEIIETNLTNLTVYTADAEQAKAVLDADGWTVNEDGLREKEIDGEKVVLDLTMVYPEGNTVAAFLEEHFVPALAEAGIRLTMKPMPMTELLQSYYKQGERDMDMIYVASNFDVLFDPAVQFQLDEDGEPNWSFTRQSDRELYDLALSMRQTEPGDVLTYVQRWIAFQERFNQVLPVLPIYSNVYFDFYTPVLRNYAVAEHTTWTGAIVGAYMSDEPPAEAEEEPGTEEIED